jgi:magnesium transporter
MGQELAEQVQDQAVSMPSKGLQVGVDVAHYDAASFEETSLRHLAELEACPLLRPGEAVNWINVTSLDQAHIFDTLGQCFDLHPLVIEDILHGEQRPKQEDYEDYIYIVIKDLTYDEQEGHIDVDQVSIVLGSWFVLSVQGKAGDPFNGLRDRLRSGKGRLRKLGADYLAYCLIDAIVDNYFVVLEKIGDRIDLLEETLAVDPDREALKTLHNLKREMLTLRSSLWPLREVISALERRESPLITETTSIYLRDVYDHIIQVIDTTETYRDVLSGMLDIYLSSVSNRMNEVMKVLTVISTIFMPLTFIAGVYGMNFHYMPELTSRWGYPAALVVMALIAATMIRYFRRRGWF